MTREEIRELWLKLQNAKAYEEVYELLDGAINNRLGFWGRLWQKLKS